MNLAKTLIVVVQGFSLCGCSAFGVPATSDPWKKLDYAYQLMSFNRFIPAERITGEALEIFKEKSDEGGIAEAYHTFGNLNKNHGISLPPNKNYFDGIYTYQQRMELSREYFEKAAQIYEDQQNFMGLTKSYFGIANVYGAQGENLKACEWLERSLRAFNQGKEKDPKAHLPILTGWKDVPEMINAFKKKQTVKNSFFISQKRKAGSADPAFLFYL